MINEQEMLYNALSAHKAGDIKLARTMYEGIIDQSPENHEAEYFLGILCYETGDKQAAIEHMEKAALINPNREYIEDLSRILYESGEYSRSLEWIKKLSEPEIELLYKLGTAFGSMGEAQRAYECFEIVSKLLPDNPEVLYNLANSLKDMAKYQEGINYYNKALAVKPDFAVAWNNMGVCFTFLDKPDEAIKCFKNAVEFNNFFIEAYNNLGDRLRLKGEFQEAEYNYKKALELNPESADAYCGLGFIYLQQKYFEKGWKYYEYRFLSSNKTIKPFLPDFNKPVWDGNASLEGKTIYVYREQAFGDAILFSRFLPVLSSLGAKIILKPYSPLKKLFENNKIADIILAEEINDADLEFDYWIPLMSLPYVLKINQSNMPGVNGFLKANPDKAKLYKEAYFNNDKFKIGICWHCKNTFLQDFHRSIPHVNSLQRIFELDNARIYSLQKGAGEEQLSEIPYKITNLAPIFNDFSDTAAAIENLDLIISVDTAVPLLAGALGKPVWILLEKNSDWKWFIDTEESLWFNNARLFRQTETDNWEELLDRVITELKLLILEKYK